MIVEALDIANEVERRRVLRRALGLIAKLGEMGSDRLSFPSTEIFLLLA